MEEFQYQVAQQSATDAPSSSEAPSESSGLFNPSGFLLLIGIFAFMYFFVIRPQKKEEKRKKELLNTLNKGDRVITMSGIIGNVYSLKTETIVLNVGDAKIEFLRSAITNLYNPSETKTGANNNDTKQVAAKNKK